MGGTLAKLLVGAFFVALSSQLGELAQELIGRARESVQASELMTIDGQLATWAIQERRTRAPRDQEEFERALRGLLSARGGREVTVDRWGQAYVYQRRGDQPAWRITSLGPDRSLGTPDDLVVERTGDLVERSRDPVAIAEAAQERLRGGREDLLTELDRLRRSLQEEDADASRALDAALGGDAEAKAEAEAALAQLDALLN
jgi:hypothetical protein